VWIRPIILSISLICEFSPTVVDTLYKDVHVVEPFYASSFFAPNLGSENSAAQATPIKFYNQIGLELGHDQYHPLSDQFDPDVYYDTNRSYWGIHYGRGAFLQRVSPNGQSSDNLQVDFYRRFARGIKLNFEFDTFSDDSWIGTQANRQRNVAVRLIQEAKRGNRCSYISIQNYAINEAQSRSFLPASGVASDDANSDFSDFQIVLGNQVTLKDSLANNSRLSLRSSLQFASNRYSFLDESVQPSEREIYIAIPDQRSVVDLNNQLRTIQFRNELVLKNDNSEISAFLTYNNKSFRNTRDTIPINELILGLNYERNLNESIYLTSNGQLGVGDIFGQVIDSIDIWQNEFEKSSYLDINLSGSLAGFDVSLGALQLGNGVFLDADATPTQLNTAVMSLSAMISRDIDFWIFKSQHRLIYNQINNDIILAPDIQLAGRLSTGTFLKKYNAHIDLGLDYYFIPSYTAPAFHHVFGRFYNNGLIRQSGDVAIVNPYLTIQIDNLAFFVKSVNATAIALGSQRTVNLTPVQSRGLFSSRVVFGLKWRLLD